jgi:hypothetical protein
MMVGLLLSSAVTANADLSGAQMKPLCESSDPYLLGYITGWMAKRESDVDQLELDEITTDDAQYKKFLIARLELVGGNICLPKGTSAGTAWSLVCDRVKADPYLGRAQIDAVVRVTLSTTFPCKAND